MKTPDRNPMETPLQKGDARLRAEFPLDSQLARRMRFLAGLAALGVALVGVLVLLGWACDIEYFRRLSPSMVAMNPATAVAFIFAGLSLWGKRWAGDDAPQEKDFPRRRMLCHLSQVLALLVGLIGVLKLSELILGWNTGVDKVLFFQKVSHDMAVGVPNRMAPNTALNFLFVSGALFFIDRGPRPGLCLSQALCIPVLLSALFALAGYLYGITSFYAVGSFIPMALHTSVAFVVLAMGIILARPRCGLMTTVVSDTLGGTSARFLLPIAALAPILLGWLRLHGERSGLYDTATGVALHAVLTTLLMLVAIFWGAYSIGNLDAIRRMGESDLKDAFGRLHSANQANRLILDYSLDVICTIDESGRFMQVSPACSRVWGYSHQELAGRRYVDFVHPEDVEKSVQAASQALAGQPIRDFKNRYIRKDGSAVPLVWSAVWSHEDKTLFCVARDDTERQQAETAIRHSVERAEQAMMDAEKANLAKSEFLSRMSHELRTPMNAILGFAQLLEIEDPTPRQIESIEQILKGGRHLLGLINEVLDIARIEAGKMPLSPEAVNVQETLEEAISLIRPLANERAVRVHFGAGCECFVLADHQRLKQVFLNLLSNAVKYNQEQGSVTISCEKTSDSLFCVRIADTGLGIPPEDLEKLFTPFERLGAVNSGIEGTGLGLSLSKRLVEAMGGSLTVESAVGKGTTLCLTLPQTSAPGEQIMIDGTHGSSQQLFADNVTRKVLYIEDNLSNMRLIERILQRYPQIELVPAMQGRLGIDLAREHQPDLVLLDLHLPDIMGYEVLRRLQADDATRHIPVVMLSADASLAQVERLLAAGAYAYLTKPFDIARFLQLLEELLADKAK